MYVLSPLEMCAVGGFVRRGARSYVCHHSSCLSYMGQIDVTIFVVRAGWCPQVTNEHCEVLFIHKCSCVYQ